MIKILLIALLSVQVLARDINYFYGFEPIPDGEDKMKLTTGDLKRFSVHALNLLSSKCPGTVSSDSISKIQKYISKAIADAELDSEILPGNDEKFSTIIRTMTDCSNAPKVASKTPFNIPSIFFKDFGSVRLLNYNPIEVKDAESPSKLDESENVEQVKDELPEFKGEENAKEAADKNEKDSESVPIVPHSTVPKSSIFSSKNTPPKKHSNAFLDWISSIFDSVSFFFGNLFGGNSRKRRSISSDDYLHKLPTDVTEFTSKDYFKLLFGKICNVYCDQCSSGVLSTRDFKKISQELLEYLFSHVDQVLIDSAAKHLITTEFIDSLIKCN